MLNSGIIVDRVTISHHGRQVDFNIDSPDDYIQKHIKSYNSFYEIDLLEELFHRSLPEMKFIDVGANIGNHTLYLAGICGLNGVAIEPYLPNFDRLTRHLIQNGLQDQVFAQHLGLGAHPTRGVCMVESGANTGMCRVEERPDGDVEIQTLDEVAAGEFHILKLDVEGGELGILRGGEGAIDQYKPLIVCEAQDLSQFISVRDHLSRFSYRPTRRYCVTPTYFFEAKR